MNIFKREKAPRCEDISKSHDAIRNKMFEYSCPKCDEEPPEEFYDVKGVTYPLVFNEQKGSTIDGNFWDWDEVHYCKKCDCKFWYTNGAY